MTSEQDNDFDDKTDRRERFERNKQRDRVIGSQGDAPRRRRTEPYRRERFDYSDYLDDDSLEE